ncbi:HipA domain-containing protein [Candidatus Saganbacteria bacterium]|nr:HipA domain-containing protein [Candidatus Saganbacteria bacterium]
MNRCPITYEECGHEKYSKNGLKLLSPGLLALNDFPYSAKEQIDEAVARAEKMSIQGIQPKLSVRLNIREQIFEVVDAGGNYIIKPQHEHYVDLPQNEDLTMKLAKTTGIETPLHGMVYSKDGSLSYFIKRFDRLPKNRKVPLEDFAQLAGKSRQTKYDCSMEKVAEIIESYCTFPAIEKIKLFKLVLFNYLVGNEDMHLKNYSLIRIDGRIQLSPAYDLINTTIAIKGATEELALTLAGKKKNIKRGDLFEYFARQKLELNDSSITGVVNDLRTGIDKWPQIIGSSFLSSDFREKYIRLFRERSGKIFAAPGTKDIGYFRV